MNEPSTPSESLFAAYLNTTGRRWSFAPTVGRTMPDFLVDERVVCEVTAIEGNYLPAKFGAIDAPHPLRQKIRDKWRQAEAARTAGHPFVLVVHKGSGRAILSQQVATAALFGDISISMSFDPTTGTMGQEEGLVFGRRGATEPTGNRNLSALALLREFNATLVDFRAAVKEVGPISDPQEGIRLYSEIEERLTRDGVFDPDAACTRVFLVHTRQPEHPLPAGWLGGGYDEEWAVEPSSGELKQVHVGPLHHQVPGAVHGPTGRAMVDTDSGISPEA